MQLLCFFVFVFFSWLLYITVFVYMLFVDLLLMLIKSSNNKKSCRLDYCNSILYNVPMNKTDRQQRLQKQCERILIKSPHREHITLVLKKTLKIEDGII